MASSVDDPVERLQEEVSCSICLEYLRDPVTIDCGHNFCQACISDYCKRRAGSTTGADLCPQCRVGFLLSSSRPNKQLANIVEGIERLARRPSQGLVEALCEKHGKKLRLFCQDDGESICLVCDKSREHRMHSVLPIEEAAQDYKMKLQKAMDVLRKTLAEATKLEVQEKEKTDQWKLSRATVHDPQTGKLITAHYRVSKSAWLSGYENPVVARINKRIQDLTGLDVSTAEELQVANYGVGGQYEPHFDFGRKDEPDAFKELGTGNRIATWLFYMSDVAAGGATVFPEVGASVWPKKGTAVFWYNLFPSGEGDYSTRHAACPVLVGNKWVSNKWIHERGQEFRRRCALSEFE